MFCGKSTGTIYERGRACPVTSFATAAPGGACGLREIGSAPMDRACRRDCGNHFDRAFRLGRSCREVERLGSEEFRRTRRNKEPAGD